MTRFNSENILSSLALETGTVNYNLIINSTSLQSLLLGAVKILRRMTRYKTPARESVFFAYSNNPYHFPKKSRIDTFIPASFNGIVNWSFLTAQKIILKFSVFCLFDDVKTNELELYFCKVFDKNVFVKSSTLGTVIYLVEKIYHKDIY